MLATRLVDAAPFRRSTGTVLDPSVVARRVFGGQAQVRGVAEKKPKKKKLTRIKTMIFKKIPNVVEIQTGQAFIGVLLLLVLSWVAAKRIEKGHKKELEELSRKQIRAAREARRELEKEQGKVIDQALKTRREEVEKAVDREKQKALVEKLKKGHEKELEELTTKQTQAAQEARQELEERKKELEELTIKQTQARRELEEGHKKELEELTRKQTQASRELEEHLTDVYRHFFSISGSETVVPQLQEELLLIGPYQAFILTGSVGKKQYKLLFLGEEHTDIPKNEKGMLIWNFFKKVDEQRGMNLFVEQPIARKSPKNVDLYRPLRRGTANKFDTISEVRRFLADCIPEEVGGDKGGGEEKKSNCPLRNTNVFPIDSRGDYGPNGESRPVSVYDQSALIEFLREKISTEDTQSFFEYVSDLVFNPTLLTETRVNSVKKITKKLQKLIRPIRSILSQVNGEDQEKIKTWFKMQWLDVLPNSLAEVKGGKTDEEYEKEYGEPYVHMYERNVASCLMDLYAVCKIFLHMTPMESKKANIVYAGALHISAIVDFFTKFGFDHIIIDARGAPEREKKVRIKMKDLEGILDQTIVNSSASASSL